MFHLKLSKTSIDIHWSFISLAISAFAHLLLRIVIGNDLGPASLGLYTLTFTIYMFGMQLSGFGIGAALTKYISQYHDNYSKINEFVSAGLLGSIVSGSIMGFLLYNLSGIISTQFFHNSEMIILLKITSLCYPFIATQKAVLGVLNGLREIKSFAVINIVLNLLVVAVSIFLVVYLNMNVLGAVIGLVLPTIIMGLLSLLYIKGKIVVKSQNIGVVLKEICFFGFFVVMTNSIGLINSQIDSIMIGHFINETEVGYYAVAAILIEGLGLIPGAFGIVNDNRIVQLYAKKEYEAMIKVVKNSFFTLLLITIFESLILVFLGKFVIQTLFGESFIPAYQPLLILLVGYSLFDPTISISGFLPGIGKVALSSQIYFVCALLNTFLNILLVPKYGIIGASVATTSSLIFATCIRLYIMGHYLKQFQKTAISNPEIHTSGVP